MMIFSSVLAWFATIAAALLLSQTSFAQTKETAKITDASSLRFDSVFEDYQSLRDEKMLEWKTANEVVTRIGGWREYAKQAQAATVQTQPAEKAGSPSEPPPANPQAGHGSKP